MPSFAKILPGTKRANASNYCGDDTAANQFQPPTSYFPLIPNQPSFQTVPTHNVDLSNKQEIYIHHIPQIMEQQQMHAIQIPTATQMNPAYLNPYRNTAATMYTPQMAYQMINMTPSQYQRIQQQQQYNYLHGSGDNTMASTMNQIHLQQQQQQNFEQTALVYPFQQQQQYPQQFFQNTDMFQYCQAPYAVQSMPCFGTPCTSSNESCCGGPSFPMSPPVYDKTGHGVIHQSLPEMPQPVYSASMPEICLGAQNPQHSNSTQIRNTKKCFPKTMNSSGSGGKKEVSIVVEDSNSAFSNSSSEDENESRKDKSTAVLKLREIRLLKEEKKAKEDAKYVTLGPESTPDKIPTKRRLAHTPPIRIKPATKEPEFDIKFEERQEVCNQEKESCANCTCCQKKVNDVESYEKQLPQGLDEKVKEFKNKLTPRKKGKPVVVAVHDIFPSDASVSEPESDLDSARKSCCNYVGSNGSVIHLKRKPRMDTILKTKLRGDSSEVFDDLENDLSPDEARTYNGDYLVELLTSDNWNSCYTALQIIVRLARHRPKVLLSHLNGPILWYTFKHIISPKSALCRAAIVTFKELFQTIGSALDNELEKITEKLVLKSLAPNMFIREECDRALEAMVGHCNLVKVLNAMDIVSKKPHSRAAGHRLASMALQIVQVAGVDVCLKPVYAEKLLPMLFSYMTEANNGTRTAAKEALGLLMNHLQFETAVTKHVTFDKNCTEVFKKLDKMRGRNRNRRQVGNPRFPLPHAHFRR